ncbi:S8 family serine peptidase [Clostridium sardiniense]|uniref:S8 family serine peptidase n=1 Tax=Clostridium sardiniense TaxID=29369 RepID=A0ABS7KX80_CLOSR|nr:S8 family serine peptidase [Clostridium sardiniense]MBY0755416.1 S8 family serine peptidase [Clostridium sardiniense]MDQ0459864.1 lactocepin [Clostridium sardiniense]
MKSKFNRVTSSLVSGAVLTSILVTANPSMVKADEHKNVSSIEQELLNETASKIKTGDKFAHKNSTGIKKNEDLTDSNNPDEVVRLIVQLNEKSAAEKIGDAKKATKADVNWVVKSQSNVKAKVEQITDSKVRNSYGNVINGFSIDAKRKDIDKIQDLSGVKKVTEAKVYYPTMATAKKLTQNINLWKDYKYKGEGLVVSIIDTGIDYTHKDMKSPSNEAKLKITNKKPNGPGKYYTEKIPYGYNFADKNDKIIDQSGSMHGMHVAGIVGADGNASDAEKGEAVQGVAPESQLLAMKVFSNNPNIKGAYSDDIVAAVEKSVELGADVINMSLGSVAGYVDANDPEQKAIKEATDAGVVCVVSAGNSATSTDPFVHKNQKDTATVGSPGLADDAIEVASYENTITTLNALTLKQNGEPSYIGFTQGRVDPSDVFKSDKELEIVDCGLGKESDFKGKDVKGKVALVQRGEISFVDKQNNAQNAGASAVIVYNKEEGYLNMEEADSLKISALFVSKSDGLKLKSNGAKIKFEGKNSRIPNVAAGEMSSFTSWGPTPDLQFAPEITAPGGNIYSTLNNNRYGSKSGTSMAAPNTSGVTALVLQGLKERGIKLSGRDLVIYTKNTLINTAEILNDKTHENNNLPYSPRRQGSGMVQAENALKNNVIAVGDDGQATISLKEVGNSTSFNITLKNYGDKEETYSLETPGGVLTSYEPEKAETQVMSYDIPFKNAKLSFDNKKVTVPANGTVKVKATLDIDKGAEKNNYAEGYIRFKNENKDGISLVVPYMGFYGDWSAEKIISPMIWDNESKNYDISSFAVVPQSGNYNYAGFEGRDKDGKVKVNENKIAISPNKDNLSDEITPALYLLRNAKEISVDILDKDNNVIAKNVNKDINFHKKVLGEKGGKSASINGSISWNGKVYNKDTGKEEVAPEGQYYMRLNSKIDFKNAKTQQTLIPVKVDVTAPKIHITSKIVSDNNDYKLTYTVDENNSGVNASMVFVNGDKVNAKSTDGKNYTADVKLKDNTNNVIEVAALDNAFNIGKEEVRVSTKKKVDPKVTFYNLESGSQTNNKNLVIKGNANEGIGKLKIKGIDVKIGVDGNFEVPVTLDEGINYISVYAEDTDGNVVMDSSEKIYCDTIAPVITLDNLAVSKDGVITIPSNKLVLKGNVSDNTIGYKFSINGEVLLNVSVDGEYGSDVTRRTFNKELSVNNNEVVTLKAEDSFGNTTINKYKININPMLGVSLGNISNGQIYNKDVNPSINFDENTYYVNTTLNGKPYKIGTPITNEGEYILEISAGLKNVKVLEARQIVKFSIDKTAPKIEVQGVENNKAYNSAVVPTLNLEDGSSLVSATLDGKPYDFSAVLEEGNHKLNVKAKDLAGNIGDYLINFAIDKTAPVVTVDGIENNGKYASEVKPTIKVNEPNSKVKATLNGEDYDGKPIKDNGKYILTVLATDPAGNTSEKSVRFAVDKPVPANMKENPTPVPVPADNNGDYGIKADPINDDKEMSKDKSRMSKGKNIKGKVGDKASENLDLNNKERNGDYTEIPKTGYQENILGIILAGVGCVLVAASGIFAVLRKRKRNL